MDTTEIDQRLREIQREYLDFLDDDVDQGIYTAKVKDMISNNNVRLTVNINDLRRKMPARSAAVIENSFEDLVAFQRALKEFVASADPVYSKQHDDFFVGFEGSFGSKHVTPRSLTSRFLGNMVCVEGIVTKCSLVRPKVVRSVHYCQATKKTIERKYSDMTSLEAFPTSAVYPTKDEDGNPLETEFGLSSYKDHQTFTIQEMPEKAPAGQLPRSVDIVVDNDLVDMCKPGDRVQVVGTYRCLPGKKNGFTTGTFRTVMIANNIQLLSKELSPLFSADDVVKIKKFSRQKGVDVFELLSKSLAPSIHGHEYIKKAVLCMLLGGVEKVLENGTRIRGDINLLLIGDPSVAKSQMLRYVLHTAPRAIPTTGRGSSGVGLTAAVTTDQETGERRLEAGAMVLADRGVVCIDEFDKMSDIDRTAIHEVMEQGRVTIAKAGIHAKLNARCSVLAAANPVYGRYDQYKTPMENIGLQDSLLSRFDLLFIMLDKMDPDSDRQISDHVLRMHRYRNTGEQDGDVLPMGGTNDLLSTKDPERVEEDEDEETPIFEKYDALLHGATRSKKDKIVSMKFMRKYIHVAKVIKPQLTREAADFIADEYSKLRNQENLQQDHIARTQPVTARCLETMIRLATAHAKARLSKNITLDDAQSAIELIQFAYFKKVEEKLRKRRHRSGDSDTEDDDDEGGDDKGEKPDRPARRKRQKKDKDGKPRERKTRRKPGEEGYDPFDFDTNDEETASEDEQENPSLAARRAARRSRSQSQSGDEAMETQQTTQDKSKSKGAIDEKRLKTFKATLFNLFKEQHAQSLNMAVVKERINEGNSGEPFSEEDVYAAVDVMMEDNQIMLSNEILFLI
ncbi:zygotic DNA replication licensing factor mcm3-like [Lingula anatina]|uniref:DNA replication licensing factor MCM3 n=1 Tax=Lingula anatina TaxID=7574 RepID=A0A1S3JHT5_LINAN|nr:zygotic DNA replication licensing factor mcm3-like [Lingula anatina]XP_013409928.1 zygotic DNA replication licensing factor mcm3-like [Lingula anatina]|eukprot:XP_013393100.1 zygotic DNA replication licensing factor mcm3-like [Lingula anatina]